MLQEMILQNRNHPSIILWGVCINESVDDDAFYNRTNKIAHQLDPSRATSGVRYHRRAAGNAGALFLHVPTPWNSKQARPAGLACLQYQNKCFRLLCVAAGVCTRFCRFILDTNEPPSELHGFEIFSKKRKKPVCTVLNDRLCIPPEHPSNFHLGNPNRKNRVEGKRIEKSWIFQIIVRRDVNFAFAQWGPDDTKWKTLPTTQNPLC